MHFKPLLKNLEDMIHEAEQFKTVDSFAKQERAWRNFLSASNRFWNHGKKISKIFGGSFSGWWGAQKAKRKSEELLCYLLHARNSGDHSIVPIMENSENSSISLGVGGGSTYIKNLTIDSNGNNSQLDMTTTSPLPIQITPAGAQLKSVVDRNKTYYPPNFADGHGIKIQSPEVIMDFAVKMHRVILNEAEKKFGD